MACRHMVWGAVRLTPGKCTAINSISVHPKPFHQFIISLIIQRIIQHHHHQGMYVDTRTMAWHVDIL